MKYGYAYIDGGFRLAIAKEGRKWNQLVFMTDGANVVCRSRRQLPRFQPVTIPLKRLATRMLRKKTSLGTKRTITKGAEKVLREAKTQ